MATKTWTGSGGTFSTNELWFPSVAPTLGDIAVIDTGTVTAIGILPDLLVIDLNSSVRSTPTLVLSGAMLPASSLLNIKAGQTDAILRVSGTVNSRGTITASSTGSGITFISIDDGPGGTATNFVNNGRVQLNDTSLRVAAGNNAADQFENNGLISIRSPSQTPQLAVIAANLAGTGSVVLGSFVTFEAVQAVSAAQTVVFEHGSVGATLRMDAGKRFGAAIDLRVSASRSRCRNSVGLNPSGVTRGLPLWIFRFGDRVRTDGSQSGPIQHRHADRADGRRKVEKVGRDSVGDCG